MTRSALVRRTAASTMAAALLGASLGAAHPTGPLVQAVVSYRGVLAQVAGVHVVATLPTLHMSVVRGPDSALRELGRSVGVTGLAPDDAMQLTSREDNDRGARGVLASAGLGGNAGQPGAGAGVRVAVIDTGVSDTAALNRASGRLVDGADSSRVADGRPVATGGTFDDGYGHGTFMADLVAGGPVEGTRGHALGVAPGATVVVVRVAKQDGTTSLSRVLGGLDWVASHASSVDIANLSLSHERPQDAFGADPLTAAVEQVRDAGVTVVVSAGNTPGTVGDPGFDPKALTVGAAKVDHGRARVAGFSGSADVYGVAKPEVVASGVDVLSLLPPDSVIAQSPGTKHLDHGLFRGSGTSQSTAIVSGVAALFLADNPGATPLQVKASLRCAARDLHGRRDGAGLVQATSEVCAGTDGQALDGSGDASGEVDFNANAWAANAWAANAWAANAWAANAWAANAWAANAWAANAWAANAWAGTDWGTSS